MSIDFTTFKKTFSLFFSQIDFKNTTGRMHFTCAIFAVQKQSKHR
jgi:hypothetical protein